MGAVILIGAICFWVTLGNQLDLCELQQMEIGKKQAQTLVVTSLQFLQ